MSKNRPARRGGSNPSSKSRKMKSGRGLSPSKRQKLDERRARIAQLDRDPARAHRHEIEP